MDYRIIRSFRKSVSISIEKDFSVLVRAPYFVSDKRILKILKEKESWIKRKTQQLKQLPSPSKISREEADILRKKAREYILPRVKVLSEKTGLDFSGVKITSARKRFGSCNSKGNLCFSFFLMLAGPKEIDYVIIHELCHTREMNHSKKFYELVASYLPDYQIYQKKLKEIIIPEISD